MNDADRKTYLYSLIVIVMILSIVLFYFYFVSSDTYEMNSYKNNDCDCCKHK